MPDVNLTRKKIEAQAKRPMAVSPLTFFIRCWLFIHRFIKFLALKFYLEIGYCSFILSCLA